MQEYRGKTEQARVGLRVGPSESQPACILSSSSKRGVYRQSVPPRIHSVSPSTNQTEREFVEAISQAMEGSLIRYSKRLELMAMAERLGIGRFQANLLIAQTQQRSGQAGGILIREPDACGVAGDRRVESDEEASRRDKLFLLAALFIIAAIVDMVIVRLFFAG